MRAVIVFIVAVFIINSISLSKKYNNALGLAEAGKYNEAISAFESLGDHKDSEEKIYEVKYKKAEALLQEGNKAAAAVAFGKVADY